MKLTFQPSDSSGCTRWESPSANEPFTRLLLSLSDISRDSFDCLLLFCCMCARCSPSYAILFSSASICSSDTDCCDLPVLWPLDETITDVAMVN